MLFNSDASPEHHLISASRTPWVACLLDRLGCFPSRSLSCLRLIWESKSCSHWWWPGMQGEAMHISDLLPERVLHHLVLSNQRFVPEKGRLNLDFIHAPTSPWYVFNDCPRCFEFWSAKGTRKDRAHISVKMSLILLILIALYPWSTYETTVGQSGILQTMFLWIDCQRGMLSQMHLCPGFPMPAILNGHCETAVLLV